jgi:hypothetical protein
MKDLVGVLRGQRVEEEIRCPRYLIGATGEGAVGLRQAPEQPLPLRHLIFLNSDDDIRVWLLANNGYEPLDLLVVEPRSIRDAGDQTPEPPNGMYPFLNRTLWENVQGHVADDMGVDDEDEELVESESDREPEAPSGPGVINVDDDDVSIDS